MSAILGENLTRVCAVAWALSSVIDLPRLSAFRTSFPVLALLVRNRASTTNFSICLLFRSTVPWTDELVLRIAVVGFRRSMKDFSFVTFVGIFFRGTFICFLLFLSALEVIESLRRIPWGWNFLIVVAARFEVAGQYCSPVALLYYWIAVARLLKFLKTIVLDGWSFRASVLVLRIHLRFECLDKIKIQITA